MPVMSSFNPDKQLFFMDSHFACLTKNIGLITDDLSQLIDGLGSFVRKEQRRKLTIYYRYVMTIYFRYVMTIYYRYVMAIYCIPGRMSGILRIQYGHAAAAAEISLWTR